MIVSLSEMGKNRRKSTFGGSWQQRAPMFDMLSLRSLLDTEAQASNRKTVTYITCNMFNIQCYHMLECA